MMFKPQFCVRAADLEEGGRGGSAHSEFSLCGVLIDVAAAHYLNVRVELLQKRSNNH